MTRLERYKEKLSDFEAKRMQLLRTGNYVRAMKLDEDINELAALIEQMGEGGPKPIKELLSAEEIEKLGIIPLVIECHLAADFLTDCAYNLNDIIENAGFHAVSIIPEIKEIAKKSEAFASALAKNSPALTDLLTNNETLISALHKKTLSYIAQRAK